MNKLKIGDFIEVHRYEREGVLIREKWISAQVIAVYPHEIHVRYVKDSTQLEALSFRDKGRTWR
jgi:protein associated with RNAse G/E